MVQMVKNLPAVQETRVQFLHWEDPLEKEMATHSSILAWEIPWLTTGHGVAKSQTRLSDSHTHGFSSSHVWMEELDHKEG